MAALCNEFTSSGHRRLYGEPGAMAGRSEDRALQGFPEGLRMCLSTRAWK